MKELGSTVTLPLSLLHQLHTCVRLAAKHPHIGHQSISHTEETIDQHLDRLVIVDKDIIMSALWSAKMLEELSLLRKDTGLQFKELVKSTGVDVDEFYFWEKNK